MIEITTDLRKSQMNYISSSLCSTSATGNNGYLLYPIVFPGARTLIGQKSLNPQYQENLLQEQFPRKLDSLSNEMSESYERVLKENKDVLMLLAE